MKVQDGLLQARFIEIHQVFAENSRYSSDVRLMVSEINDTNKYYYKHISTFYIYVPP